MCFASGCNAGSDASVIFKRNFGSSELVWRSFFISIDGAGDAIGVFSAMGEWLFEFISNDTDDAVDCKSFLSISLLYCGCMVVLVSSLATVLCSSSISSAEISARSVSGEKEKGEKKYGKMRKSHPLNLSFALKLNCTVKMECALGIPAVL